MKHECFAESGQESGESGGRPTSPSGALKTLHGQQAASSPRSPGPGPASVPRRGCAGCSDWEGSGSFSRAMKEPRDSPPSMAKGLQRG